MNPSLTRLIVRPRRAFSLVELSIVLVILGLLVGGVLSGQALIRAAELRSITSDLDRYIAATHTFRDKYFALPGDMANATSFWGTDNLGCPNGGGSSGTCNGNGDGIISTNVPPNTVSNLCENQEYWRQLSLAGLIEGKYTPNTLANCYTASSPGKDSAKLKLASAGASITYVGPITTNAGFPGNVFYIGNYQHVFFVGAANNSANGMFAGGLLKPEELWNIDNKVDDGKPGTGNVLPVLPGTYNPAAGATGCTSDTTLAATYSLTNSTISCSMLMKVGF